MICAIHLTVRHPSRSAILFSRHERWNRYMCWAESQGNLWYTSDRTLSFSRSTSNLSWSSFKSIMNRFRNLQSIRRASCMSSTSFMGQWQIVQNRVKDSSQILKWLSLSTSNTLNHTISGLVSVPQYFRLYDKTSILKIPCVRVHNSTSCANRYTMIQGTYKIIEASRLFARKLTKCSCKNFRITYQLEIRQSIAMWMSWSTAI